LRGGKKEVLNYYYSVHKRHTIREGCFFCQYNNINSTKSHTKFTPIGPTKDERKKKKREGPVKALNNKV